MEEPPPLIEQTRRMSSPPNPPRPQSAAAAASASKVAPPRPMSSPPRVRVPLPTVAQLEAIERAATEAEARRVLSAVLDQLVSQTLLDAAADATSVAMTPTQGAAAGLALRQEAEVAACLEDLIRAVQVRRPLCG